MTRCFVPNFDFEHQLAGPSAAAPRHIERLNAELATAWVAVAEDGDAIWLPEKIPGEFFEQCAGAGLARIDSVRQPSSLVRCEPWGWSATVSTLCDRQGWHNSAPPLAAVRRANARQFSAGLEAEANLSLPGAGAVVELAEATHRVEAICRNDSAAAWVIKANFGMSGRERTLGRGPLTPAASGWIRKRLERDGVVFVEPWVTRIHEVGLQFELTLGQGPSLLGVVPLLSTPAGQYRGSWFAPPPAVIMTSQPPASVIQACTEAAARAAELGYHGPLGIDAMYYHGADGQPAWRPLQDINARWTMGRLSLGLRRLLQPGQSGLWWHGTVEERSQLADSVLIQDICSAHGLCVRRIVATSPEEVGGRPCRHASAAVLFDVTGPAAG